MKNHDALQIMSALRPPGSVVYSLTRSKRRSFFRELLDNVISDGALGSVADVMDSMKAAHYLIATQDAGTIVSLRDGQVNASFDLPDWRPEWRESFTKATVDDILYRKVARIDG
ncbi:MAG: hypothetical protein QM708_00930 [Propioniciclava sp.]|uniref:hypothetical protein n=1 Tax=Propioniciclava sp. TaxID=2038686 RepID=UPI0039E3D048